MKVIPQKSVIFSLNPWINPILKESDYNYNNDINYTSLDSRNTHIELTHQLSSLDDCTYFPLYYFQKDDKDIRLFDGDLFFNGETQLDDLVFILQED